MNQLTEQLIHGRTHVSPKRLGDPGPNAFEKEQILLAANAAPDHGRMLPWRFIEIQQASRQLIAEVFEKCLLDRDQYVSELQVQEAHDKAFRGPLLLLAIADYSDDNAAISKEEKLISLGCAIQNILLRSYSLGFGSGLSSGKALKTDRFKQLFELSNTQDPICFVTIGTVIKKKPNRIRPGLSEYHTIF